MTTDEAWKIVNSFLKQEIISSLQELIFCQSWQGKTYREIANNSSYTEEYIRDNGAKLWQQLSQELAQKVTKQNFKRVFEEYHQQQQQQSAVDKQQNPQQHRDWSEAIDVSLFCGRSKEITTLKQWIVKDKCRLIGIFGIGGIGKTSLTVKLAQEVASEFDFVIWRSLRNAPPFDKLLANIIKILSKQQRIEQNLPEAFEDKISKLIEYFKSYRCWLILDNGETILQSGIICGRYREGYQAYGELFKRLGEINHQSCVILTSREKPQEFSILEGKNTPIRSLQVTGVAAEAGKEICQLKGEFYASEQEWQTLTYNYSGNPLVFKIVASTIQDLFEGNVTQFLQQKILAFDDIEDLLEQQLERLSNLERNLMYWLAIEREAISLEQLQQNLFVSIPAKKLLEAFNSLKRRSLIEKTKTGFTQQPVVVEYLIEQQIEKVAQEIADLNPDLLTYSRLD